jgi:hypothetical protein
MTRLLIWGAGQHGRVVAELAELCGHEVAGFVDRTPSGPKVCGEDEARAGFASGTLPFGAERFVPAIGDCRVRLELATRYADRLAPPLVHPRAWVSPSATLGAGTVVLPMASVQTLAKIGMAVIVHGGVVVDHDAVIEDGVYLAPGAVICGGGIVSRGTLLPAGTVVGKGERFG